MQVLIWNWHTPYLTLLARALSDVEWLVLPTVGHAPSGWRLDQRPQNSNVTVVSGVSSGVDVAIIQTQADSDALLASGVRTPAVYLAHNRHEYDGANTLRLLVDRVPLVCISEMKARSWLTAGYTRPITVIRPGIPVEDYGPWRGDVPKVLTVANNVRRPLFDCDAWRKATKDLPVTLVGEGNEGLPGAVGPARDFDELREYYRSHQVYLGVNRWPDEDPHNLALLEAMATNMPVVYLSGYPDRLQTAKQLREQCERFLREAAQDRSRPWNLGWPNYLRHQFSFARFGANWRCVLEEVARG